MFKAENREDALDIFFGALDKAPKDVKFAAFIVHSALDEDTPRVRGIELKEDIIDYDTLCDLMPDITFDVVTADNGLEFWIDDCGAIDGKKPNPLASLMADCILYGDVLVLPHTHDENTHAWNMEIWHSTADES